MSRSNGVTVAAFDVDGTLTTRDCVVPFLWRLGRRPAVAAQLVRRTPDIVAGGLRCDRDRLRAAATAAVFAHLPWELVEREAGMFARLVVGARLRPDTAARLRWHAGEGHRVVLVSASYEVYLRHIAAALGADGVLATRLDVDLDGRCTGRLDGANCRGVEKVRRLTTWLDRAGLERSAVTLWAYGDSAGDRELLAAADHPVWAGEPLASVAPTA
ncbi:MAG: HAD-IB family hydrolase [Ilumatobacter sp.]|uniref:HAD family hydrolase n=1 Tax=Ilumatobacter sp. TaxID=1967498 RepID=UPI00262F17E9|nr:HAD-IB family hydrolase [Ilumatobacter sp.]MDJ0771249.1 HAD-IB family hydrolase [Ilumatobacter sp.]